METNATRARAVAGSLAIHLLLAFVLYWGMLMQPEIANAPGGGAVIEATLVAAPRLAQAASNRHTERAAARPAPTPPPPPTPTPVESPPVRAPEQPMPRQMQSQTQVPKPDTVDQDEVRRTAQLAAERAQKEQDERRRQAQIDLDRKQQQLQAENRQRQAQADAMARQLAAIRVQRAQAERQAALAAERLKQDRDMRQMLARNAAPAASAAAPSPARAASAGPSQLNDGPYKQAIADTLNRNWKHDGVPERTHCEVHFTQMRGGDVLKVSFGACPFDASARASVEDALKKEPMPYAGFEKVYQREVTIDVCYPEDACK